MLARLALALILIALPARANDRWHAVDGDTITTPAGERVRVMGVDTPELHARCASEYQAAVAAKTFTQAKLDLGPVRLDRSRRDRYGRTLARVYIDGVDLAGLLIGAGHGREYHGERRRPWC
jgi:endonuclease YncB( thermonuclease family)